MSRRFALCVTVVPALAFALVMNMLLLDGGPDRTGAAAGGRATSISGVPAQWVPDVVQAGHLCPHAGITAQVIAAQIGHESTWDPAAVSSQGAQGLAQFLPSTWAAHGVDGDGDGTADPFNGHDAIASQAAYMCALAETIRGLLAAGHVAGDPLDLTLAAYNAGPVAVEEAGGIPVNGETELYVPAIRQAMSTYTVTYASGAAAAPAQASADRLLDTAPVDISAFAPEVMSLPDPTPGAHGTALVTPRMNALITDVMATYPQIVNSSLYCWDAHTFNPSSDHPRGRACDIPFYGCAASPERSADPSTGLAAGNAAANWIVANASTYGVHYVIWNGQEWDARTGRWAPYDGAGGLYDPQDCSGGHYDHIHVSVL